MSTEGENSGGDVDYYMVEIAHPKRLDPYTAECEDIIEALKMNFAEGTAFKAIWRSCAARALGKLKRGGDAVRDAEKVVYSGGRMLAQRKIDASLREQDVHVNRTTTSNGIATVGGIGGGGPRGNGGEGTYAQSGTGGSGGSGGSGGLPTAHTKNSSHSN